MFDDLPVLKAAFIEHSDSKDLPFGGPINLPRFVPRTVHPHPDLITGGDHLFDGQVEIREGCAQKLDVALQAFNRRVQSKLMLDEVGLKCWRSTS